MAATLTAYDHLFGKILDQSIQWSNTIKMAFLDSGYTPDVAHTTWADASAHEAASTPVMTLATSVEAEGGVISWKAANVITPEMSATFRYGVIFQDTEETPADNLLLAWILFDSQSGGQDITLVNMAFRFNWHTDGVFQFGPTSAMCA